MLRERLDQTRTFEALSMSNQQLSIAPSDSLFPYCHQTFVRKILTLLYLRLSMRTFLNFCNYLKCSFAIRYPVRVFRSFRDFQNPLRRMTLVYHHRCYCVVIMITTIILNNIIIRFLYLSDHWTRVLAVPGWNGGRISPT